RARPAVHLLRVRDLGDAGRLGRGGQGRGDAVYRWVLQLRRRDDAGAVPGVARRAPVLLRGQPVADGAAGRAPRPAAHPALGAVPPGRRVPGPRQQGPRLVLRVLGGRVGRDAGRPRLGRPRRRRVLSAPVRVRHWRAVQVARVPPRPAARRAGHRRILVLLPRAAPAHVARAAAPRSCCSPPGGPQLQI
ncbi:hypothetical protein GGF43_005395, partial [Coemansia sp. RSA 2618]